MADERAGDAFADRPRSAIGSVPDMRSAPAAGVGFDGDARARLQAELADRHDLFAVAETLGDDGDVGVLVRKRDRPRRRAVVGVDDIDEQAVGSTLDRAVGNGQRVLFDFDPQPDRDRLAWPQAHGRRWRTRL